MSRAAVILFSVLLSLYVSTEPNTAAVAAASVFKGRIKSKTGQLVVGAEVCIMDHSGRSRAAVALLSVLFGISFPSKPNIAAREIRDFVLDPKGTGPLDILFTEGTYREALLKINEQSNADTAGKNLILDYRELDLCLLAAPVIELILLRKAITGTPIAGITREAVALLSIHEIRRYQ